jgi:hypothetical protein
MTMPRYVIERNLGKVPLEDVEQAAIHSKRVREEKFPDIQWDHSHVVNTDEGLRTYCIYEAPSVDRVRAHAAAAGLPADAVREILIDVDPAALG